MTEKSIITTKTKRQREAIKAFTLALKIDLKTLDHFENQIFGKMIAEGESRELLSANEQEELFKGIRK